uniref:Uncharacterized protein n=1 Tax=Rhizophora mucronata TaxID=61149 RepID=A0A2P2QE38_RHIMU
MKPSMLFLDEDRNLKLKIKALLADLRENYPLIQVGIVGNLWVVLNRNLRCIMCIGVNGERSKYLKLMGR